MTVPSSTSFPFKTAKEMESVKLRRALISSAGHQFDFKQDNVQANSESVQMNAVCFKHDDNVCACAVTALILLPVVNLLLEMDSATSISL